MLDFPVARSWEIFWSDCDVYCNENGDFQVDEQLKEFAQAHENPCSKKHTNCLKGKRKTIFGKVFDCLCTSTMSFENPNTESLVYIKKLSEIRKKNIADMQCSK